MKIVIAGAGIGGLTAAMCLCRAGFDVTVFEAVGELRPLGVGINIQAGAVRILSGLGLEPALAGTAIETRELRYANRHGQTIWADPRGRHAGLPWPQFSIHRGELQMILFNAARQMLGAERIKFGRRIAGFEQKGGKVTARFVDRDGKTVEEAEADILIGADGIHSAVRAHFYPDEGPPKWQGILMWRGVTVGKPFLGGATMVQAGHHNQKFVCYPISRAHAEKGEALINWICDLHMGDGAMLPREDWNRPGKLADFLPRFEDWKFDWLDVPGVIRGGARHLRIPHGRPRSAAALVARPGHACWATPPIRCIRSARTAPRRRSSTARRSPRNFWPAAIPRRPCSATSSAACRPRRASSKAIAARASTSCSTSSSSARRRDFRSWKACCRPTSSRRSSPTTRSSPPRIARRCSAWRRDNKKPALFGDRPW